MLTPKAVAARLGVSQATVYGLLSSGKLRAYRIGAGRGVYRVSEDQLNSYLAGAEPVIERAPAPAQRVKLRHIKLT